MPSMAGRRLDFVAAAVLIAIFLFGASQLAPNFEDPGLLALQDAPKIVEAVQAKSPVRSSPVSESIYWVHNETLGFQKVYVISLPERTDKQDTLALQAAFSDISYTLADGANGQVVPARALPHTMSQKDTIVGCWRAHMNVYQRMVREKVSTALIFEDDADWDVALKHQLVQLARGSRFIMNATDEDTPHSPYGDDWDVLWLGHCGTFLPDERRRFFVIPGDPTVQPPQFLEDNVAKPNMSRWRTGPDGGERTRIVFLSDGAVCTAAYAISQEGARKALYHMSMVPYSDPVDWGLANLCKGPLRCISSWPQLVGVSRPTSRTAKWSDVDYDPSSGQTVEQGVSFHVVYSTRQNIPNLLRGERVFHSQYPDFAPPMQIQDIGKAIGYAEIRDPEYPTSQK